LTEIMERSRVQALVDAGHVFYIFYKKLILPYTGGG
jgi:hypothetical protein